MTHKNKNTASLAHAKAHFADCVRKVEKGQSIVLTRHGRPVARLVSFQPPEGDPGWTLQEDRRQPANELHERVGDYESRTAAALSDVEARRAALARLLENEIWPQIPEEMIGKGPTKKEREEILGIREDSP